MSRKRTTMPPPRPLLHTNGVSPIRAVPQTHPSPQRSKFTAQPIVRTQSPPCLWTVNHVSHYRQTKQGTRDEPIFETFRSIFNGGSAWLLMRKIMPATAFDPRRKQNNAPSDRGIKMKTTKGNDTKTKKKKNVFLLSRLKRATRLPPQIEKSGRVKQQIYAPHPGESRRTTIKQATPASSPNAGNDPRLHYIPCSDRGITSPPGIVPSVCSHKRQNTKNKRMDRKRGIKQLLHLIVNRKWLRPGRFKNENEIIQLLLSCYPTSPYARWATN